VFFGPREGGLREGERWLASRTTEPEPKWNVATSRDLPESGARHGSGDVGEGEE
jgi:hypothetical protein